ncbi:major capsid protein [Rhodococcus sp. KRD162]|uniref:major capsid protein n=1 Tax=Rhodococcus sp. KRD162 TaxID=2729725 RepID=UPI0019D03217|nr:major capsid protein [Rhodococcus sp. KRD162]
MPNALIPELNGRRLTVDVALNQPSVLRNRIAALADPQLVLDKFFTSSGLRVEGGGILYSVIKASDFYTAADIERRTPGSEYTVVEGVNPEPRLAPVIDWGGKFQVLDEQIRRNDVSYVDQQTTQLTNTIVRKLNDAAITAVEASLGAENTLVGHNWTTVITTGPEANLTPNAGRPAADFADAQLAADLQELGIAHDLLVLHPNQARALKVAYGEDLAAVLESNGFTNGMFSSPRIAAGTGYAVAKGQAGVVGFEEPLKVESYDDRSTRSKWVQGYCVPSMAVEKPYAIKKITGLAG